MFPAQSKIDRKSRTDSEVILSKERVLPCMEFDTRKTDALLIVAGIAFTGRPRSRCTCNSRRGLPVYPVNEEIVDVVIGIGTRLKSQVCDVVSYAVDVSTEFERVSTMDPRNSISELDAPLVREFRPFEESRSSKFQTVSDEHVRGSCAALCRQRSTRG